MAIPILLWSIGTTAILAGIGSAFTAEHPIMIGAGLVLVGIGCVFALVGFRAYFRYEYNRFRGEGLPRFFRGLDRAYDTIRFDRMYEEFTWANATRIAEEIMWPSGIPLSGSRSLAEWAAEHGESLNDASQMALDIGRTIYPKGGQSDIADQLDQFDDARRVLRDLGDSWGARPTWYEPFERTILNPLRNDGAHRKALYFLAYVEIALAERLRMPFQYTGFWRLGNDWLAQEETAEAPSSEDTP